MMIYDVTDVAAAKKQYESLQVSVTEADENLKRRSTSVN